MNQKEISNKHYRVAQWGTGFVGMRALKNIIEHPQYELVGLYVYTPAKIGRDAGELCGTKPTGIKATNKIDDIIAAKPDCVVYMPRTQGANVGDVCRLLESGANIVTSVTDFRDPESMNPDACRKIEDACARGKTSIYSSGSSPGFISEVLPLAVTVMERRLDHLLIEEFADLSTRLSPQLIGMMFGMDPAKMNLSMAAKMLYTSVGQSLRILARAFSTPIDEVTAKGKVAPTTKTVQIGVATIKEGTVGAWQFEVIGLRNGKPLITFRPTWFITRDLESTLNVRDYNGWHVVVEGDAPLDIDIRLTTKDYQAVSPGYNSHICVNAIPYVCEAPPGIMTIVDLPVIIPNFK